MCITTSEFLLALHFCQNEVLLKGGFGVFTGFICLILSCPTHTSRKCVCLSAEWWEQGSECSCQHEDLGSVFQWSQESKDSNHTAILKGKDIAEFNQKKRVVSKISASLHQFQLALFSYLFSHFDNFIWAFLVQVICIPYSMRRIYYASFCPLKIKLTEML